jgi:hypothetical protein
MVGRTISVVSAALSSALKRASLFADNFRVQMNSIRKKLNVLK